MCEIREGKITLMRVIRTSQGVPFWVSDEDYDRVMKYTWYAVECRDMVYIRRTIRMGKRFKVQYLHRFIMNCPKGKEVHHRNGNTMDNTRENLEVCSKQMNLHYMRCGV